MAHPEVVVDGVSALARMFVERVEERGRRALDERGRFSLVLPGGSVAEAFFPTLAGARIDWGGRPVLGGRAGSGTRSP